MNLNVFLGRQKFPNYRLVPPPSGKIETLTVHEPVSFLHFIEFLLSYIL